MSLDSIGYHEDKHPSDSFGMVSGTPITDHLSLVHGDFFKEWKRAGLGEASLILADPPYGLFGRELKNMAWDVPLDLARMETYFSKLLKPAGLVIIFCDINLLMDLMNSFSNRLEYKHFHIWKKPGGLPVNMTRPINDSEFILVFKQAGARVSTLTFNPEGMGETGPAYIKRNYSSEIPTRRMRKSKINQNLNGKRFPKTIIEAPGKPNMEAQERTDHPTQKPVVLMRKLIRTYSNAGDLVCDPFMGSGSTLVACHHENRKGVGFEIDEGYFSMASKRIRRETSQERLF